MDSLICEECHQIGVITDRVSIRLNCAKMMKCRVDKFTRKATGKPITVHASSWRLISTMTVINNGGRGVFCIIPAAVPFPGQAALLLSRNPKGCQPCFVQF